MAFTAGQKVRAADLNLLNGEWTSYTPVWSGTGVSLGNGSISGSYARVGKTCFFRIYLTMGSTTAYGSGDWSFTLPPLTAKNTGLAGNMWPSLGQALDAGTGYKVGIVQVSSGATLFQVIDPASGGFFKFNQPQTWAVNDALAVNGTYEIA